MSRWRQPCHADYLAMYSSQIGGIVTDPALWNVPADDHMVHRGDAVFEVFKCVGGRAYCLDDHLEKLRSAALALAIRIPPELGRLTDILRDTVRAGGQREALVRVTVSRGPGGFTSNPYESPAGLLLVAVLRLKSPGPEKYENGVKAVTAPFAPKDPRIATIKSCSYLHNVMVRKAALDAGADYAVCFGSDGLMTESSTENIAIVTRAGEFLAPEWRLILKGSTLTRLLALAGDLAREGLLSAARQAGITRAMVREAAEALVCSTTTDVLSIVTWDGEPVGEGRPGPAARELRRRLRAEYTDPASPWLTDFF